MYYQRHVWHYNNVYVSPRPYYRPRPPVYGPPIYARPPPNSHRSAALEKTVMIVTQPAALQDYFKLS